MRKSTPLVPGFMVIHSNQMEQLRDLLVHWTQQHPLQPLENEIILVQSNGIAQWLKYALAADAGLGIAAGIEVTLPARFLWQSYRAVLAGEAIASSSPLDKSNLTWRLMRLLPSLLTDPRFAPLQIFLAEDEGLRKRHQLCERIADIFDQYQVYRADWLALWAQGKNQIDQRGQLIALTEEPVAQSDVQQQTLAWQTELWRVLLADIGEQAIDSSRASVHPRFLEALASAEQHPRGLPRRVIVFGISSLPAQTLEALAAMAKFTQVILCVHNPCQFYWGDIVADKDLLRQSLSRHPRKQGIPSVLNDNDLHHYAHPLLAAWGKQGRDYIALLDEYDTHDAYQAYFAAEQQRIDLFTEPEPYSMLTQLQSDILQLRSVQETREQWAAVDWTTDESIRFHCAHSPQREVEILHDQLLDRFSRHPELLPRDVIVMVPDIDRYAPYIQAVFAQFKPGDARYLPFTLSDQGQRGYEPMLIALEQLLHLPESRVTASDVVALLNVPALRARFAIQEADVPVLQRWIEGAGVRWGLDAQQRSRFGLPADLQQNTWLFGLRRMLLGYVMGTGTRFAGIEAYAEVAGLEAALLGPLMQLFEALLAYEQRLGEAYSAGDWSQLFQQLLDDFFQPDQTREQLLLQQLHETHQQWAQACADAELDECLPLTVSREAWLTALDGERASQSFLAGAINICTLMPMRTIPFKLVCLLGMNDGDYPRSQPPLDFDLMAGNYRPGDRSRREDDRYLLLEALLAARDMLYISWIGRSEKDNTEQTPSVLVAQLRDHLAQGWRLTGDEQADVLAALTTEHPLQPFSAAYFDEQNPRLFTYAREWAVLHQPEQQLPPPETLPSYGMSEPISLSVLQSFLRSPVQQFFAQRFKVYLRNIEVARFDDEPFVLPALQSYQIKQQLLDAGTATSAEQSDTAVQHQLAALQRSGVLPMYAFGEHVAEQLLEPVTQQMAHYHQLCSLYPEPESTPVALTLTHEGLTLEAWLAGVRHAQSGAVQIELLNGALSKDKKLRLKRVLPAWIQHVAWHAAGVPLTTILVAEDGELQLSAWTSEAAVELLERWLSAWQQGMDQPLPVTVDSALAWLAATHSSNPKQQEKALDNAQAAYEGTDFGGGELQWNPLLRRQYPDFAALIADDTFTHWAAWLYADLQQHEMQFTGYEHAETAP